ncbi:hypothetical protein SKAU_G00304240 [Synaphobranchus kaupii]|uniref:Uncharacterized protein n=1 Tax=Synaphobranchus kaupii TaxID=118154 RepID=A0A9Q1EWE7_SYNKA|nr:hypothetical protein SKAU_G00304240 [Synaphobranchus kaupii]
MGRERGDRLALARAVPPPEKPPVSRPSATICHAAARYPGAGSRLFVYRSLRVPGGWGRLDVSRFFPPGASAALLHQAATLHPLCQTPHPRSLLFSTGSESSPVQALTRVPVRTGVEVGVGERLLLNSDSDAAVEAEEVVRCFSAKATRASVVVIHRSFTRINTAFFYTASGRNNSAAVQV